MGKDDRHTTFRTLASNISACKLRAKRQHLARMQIANADAALLLIRLYRRAVLKRPESGIWITTGLRSSHYCKKKPEHQASARLSQPAYGAN